MRKTLMILAAAVIGIGLITPTTQVSATGTPRVTVVTGLVKDGGKLVDKAKLTASCDTQTKNGLSKGGVYSLKFSPNRCKVGSTVTVTATKDGKSGTSSTIVQSLTVGLNIAIANVDVPELGTVVTGSAAGLGAAGVLYAIRRRTV